VEQFPLTIIGIYEQFPVLIVGTWEAATVEEKGGRLRKSRGGGHVDKEEDKQRLHFFGRLKRVEAHEDEAHIVEARGSGDERYCRSAAAVGVVMKLLSFGSYRVGLRIKNVAYG
jgi:hypothetical protein